MRVGLVMACRSACQRTMVATNWPELETSTPDESLQPPEVDMDSESTMTGTLSSVMLSATGMQV